MRRKQIMCFRYQMWEKSGSFSKSGTLSSFPLLRKTTSLQLLCAPIVLLWAKPCIGIYLWSTLIYSEVTWIPWKFSAGVSWLSTALLQPENNGHVTHCDVVNSNKNISKIMNLPIQIITLWVVTVSILHTSLCNYFFNEFVFANNVHNCV